MVFKSFLLGNCMKIINSVVVVGLYYGFLTTFSIGPSYLFLLRAQVMEEGEEGTEKKISATTGFITGQLMMFISIYYAPLHLALGRPHTITILALPYLLFHFFWNNHKHFFDYGSTTRNSMRNLSIQCVFLNNLIFQLFNHFILPSSMLARLVNIYMFRCNNKMLFVTSSFVGWLIGHILFMKWVGLVLVWIRQNHSIRSNVLIRSNKYLVSELRNSMARIFSILLFITCVYYLGRIPSPILTKKLKETSETEERDVEIETTSETKETKQEQEGFTKEDPSSSLFSEEKEDPNKIDETEEIRVNGKEKTQDEFHFHFKETCYKNSPVYETSYLDGNQDNSKLKILKLEEDKHLFWFEKPIVTILFDYKRWNRPFRYIKNNKFNKAVINEMSQYFFYTCQSDGKQRISFTYPLSLATFFEMIQKKISLSTTEKGLTNFLYNYWVFINEKIKNNYNLSKEFLNRIKSLNKGSHTLNGLEKRTRLCNDETKNEYLTKIYDLLINGPYRGTIKKNLQTSMEDFFDTIWINKIHSILFVESRKFEQKIYQFDRESLSKEIDHFLTLINKFSVESSFNFKKFYLFLEQGKIESGNREHFLTILFNTVITDSNDQKIRAKAIAIGINEISKKVPRHSYKLIDDLEQQEGETEEDVPEDHQIRSRKFKRVVIFTDKQQNTDTYTHTDNPDQTEEVALIRYSQQSDFRRGIIKGSMRAQRRKTITWKFFQANVHSPLFLDRIDKSIFLSFEISGLIKQIFLNWMGKKKKAKLKISDYTEEKTKDGKKREEDKREEKARIKIAEAWDTILFAQVIRGSMLVIQSILRKSIILPSLIIAKNISRILLFQFPEWSEDLKEWNREMHVKCTYNGVQLSETEFPKNWLTDGIQIKILFPFCLKPWHKSKAPTPHKETIKTKREKTNFCFLTVWGMEAELPFGSPRKRPSFFEPIFKELKKKIRKLKKECFLVFTILKERTKLLQKFSFSNETKKWFIKNALLIKQIIKELSKINLISLFGLRKVYKSSETTKEKDSIKGLIINNQMIQEPSISIQSMDLQNYSLTEKKIKDLTDKTRIIRNQIEQITKDKKKVSLTPEININTKTKQKNSNIKEPQKNTWQIRKRKNAQLIRKFDYFIQFFIERIYMDTLLCIININITTQLFLESTKKKFVKFIYNNEPNPERIDKTKQNQIHFISTIKTLFTNISDKNSKIFCDLSSLSQAYVFYKLVQTQLSNLYSLKPILLYTERPPFFKLKNEIKDYFLIQGIIHSELKQNKFRNCEMTQWKNWLTGHYQYNLYQIKLSKLVPQKWRNKIHQSFMFQNKHLSGCYLYEKDQLIDYEKENDYKEDLLPNIKENFKKHYLYDLLSYKYIKYEGKKYSYIYRLPAQVNKKQGISYNYKNNKYKGKFFDIGGIPINIEEDNIIEKTPDRKYFDWGIPHFFFINIESWLNIDPLTKKNKNTKKKKKTETNYYQIIDKIDKKFVFSLTIHKKINPSNKQKTIFDWMGMNEEILNRPISNLELWFFPEFLFLYNTYKIKQWGIPIKLLLFYFNENPKENVSENKNINGKQKGNSFRSLNDKKSLELENINQEEKESTAQGDLRSDGQNKKKMELVPSKQQKDIEEDYVRSDMKKRRKKKQYKSHTEAELDLFLKKYLLFQLRWDDSLNQRMINNVKVYCFLLRLRNSKEIAISSIQKEEMSLDIMLIQKNVKFTELMQKGILIIEPIRLSKTTNGQFIMYQTIRIPLVHKSKYKTKTNQEYPQDVDKNNFNESIERYQKMTENKDQIYYDFDLFVLENILSSRRRRELRIRIFFYIRNKNNRNIVFFNFNKNNIKNYDLFLDERKHIRLDKEKKKLIKLKLFLWPNYRLEDLACMNRYWFDTNNGSRFSTLRVHMYPQLQIQ
uniref:hypothetical chloroplast RF1 n=1 Tax=Dillenia turbinata TaxID=194707 RepID=UPI002001A7E6|nr:hypothetical chloroplast RF1 [Dillenia turbinata]UNQ85758.1 hypothetical chloroplast RF1 [Dillenia turbinata]